MSWSNHGALWQWGGYGGVTGYHATLLIEEE